MKSLTSPVFNLKALEFGAFFACFHLLRYLIVVQPIQNCAETFRVQQAFKRKNRLKIALQVSKLASGPKYRKIIVPKKSHESRKVKKFERRKNDNPATLSDRFYCLLSFRCTSFILFTPLFLCSCFLSPFSFLFSLPTPCPLHLSAFFLRLVLWCIRLKVFDFHLLGD